MSLSITAGPLYRVTPDRWDWIVWSPAQTELTYSQILDDDMPQCRTSGATSRRGTVGRYRANSGRQGHTNGTEYTLWSSSNEVPAVVA